MQCGSGIERYFVPQDDKIPVILNEVKNLATKMNDGLIFDCWGGFQTRPYENCLYQESKPYAIW